MSISTSLESIRIGELFLNKVNDPTDLALAVAAELAMPVIRAITPQIMATAQSLGERIVQSVKVSSDYFMSIFSRSR